MSNFNKGTLFIKTDYIRAELHQFELKDFDSVKCAQSCNPCGVSQGFPAFGQIFKAKEMRGTVNYSA